VEGSCEHCNEPSPSLKCSAVLEKLCEWRAASEEGLSCMKLIRYEILHGPTENAPTC
jgi:hypothetical protein